MLDQLVDWIVVGGSEPAGKCDTIGRRGRYVAVGVGAVTNELANEGGKVVSIGDFRAFERYLPGQFPILKSQADGARLGEFSKFPVCSIHLLFGGSSIWCLGH